MNPIVGASLGGPVIRPQQGRAWLGEPAWSPPQLLRDLEMRLGLPQNQEATPARRVPQWSRRLAALLPSAPFYARSFEADRLGTAKALLAWRDGLVEAGWDGQVVGDGRLATFAKLESVDIPLPPGRVDRLAAVERELRTLPQIRIYDGLRIVEARELWPRRWRTIFELLEARGTPVGQLAVEPGGANPESDLGVLQRALRGTNVKGFVPAGDGSLLVLRADTSSELAELTAALLARHRDGAVVVRCKDEGVLETALAKHGIAEQGHATKSAWRPAMQILPLALELAYEPRDPHRILELLTLPVGPFQGRFGRLLARAVSRQPGIGGSEWVEQRRRAGEHAHKRHVEKLIGDGRTPEVAAIAAEAHAASMLARLTDWLETPGARDGVASRAELIAVVDRFAGFLEPMLTFEDTRPTYTVAMRQAKALGDALAHEPESLSRQDMRLLFDRVAHDTAEIAFSQESAGRADHVNHPGALLGPARTVVFWSFVGGTERRVPVPPWQRSELAALAKAGVDFPAPAGLLRAEADRWSRGILAARERVVLVVPRTLKGEPTAPHPTWDEVAARLGFKHERDAAPITRLANDLLAGRAELVPVERLAPLHLPPSRGAWQVPAGRIGTEDVLETLATDIDKLATCPLRFVLMQHARIRGGALGKISDGPLLNGNLGHRLVEVLHGEGAFDDADDASFGRRTQRAIEELIAREGATLLLEGASFEYEQLVPELARAMTELRRYLVEMQWRIAGVEERVSTDWPVGKVKGRLDVRLVNDAGKQAVLDLKWGEGPYRALVEEGRAVQLAVYVRAIKDDVHSVPPAGYFTLKKAKIITADHRMSPDPLEGLSLEETWQSLERTARAVQVPARPGPHRRGGNGGCAARSSMRSASRPRNSRSTTRSGRRKKPASTASMARSAARRGTVSGERDRHHGRWRERREREDVPAHRGRLRGRRPEEPRRDRSREPRRGDVHAEKRITSSRHASGRSSSA